MLGLVFARLRGWLTPKGRAIASPTQSVGPVCQEHTVQAGKPCSVGTMCPLHRPANQAASQSSEAVQPTSVDQNSGSETQPVSVTSQSKAVGTKQATIARQTRRVASRAAKAKRVAALSTPLEPLSASDKALAQTPTDNQSGDNGKPKAVVRQTHQPAKSAPKQKQKPAKQGSSVKKTSHAKASAQTRTVKRSGANGT